MCAVSENSGRSVRRRVARQWQAIEKIVYSRTLAEPLSARTKIELTFDPDSVRKLKADAERDVAVAGPELAAQAIQAGLVDEFQMRICPVVVGGTKRFFPVGARLDLELIEERHYRNGEIFCAICDPRAAEVKEWNGRITGNTEVSLPGP